MKLLNLEPKNQIGGNVSQDAEFCIAFPSLTAKTCGPDWRL